MSDDNELGNLCTTEDAFEKFQSVSMHQEDEFITLSDIVSPQPQIPDYSELNLIPYDNEVVLTTSDRPEYTTDEHTRLEPTSKLDDIVPNTTENVQLPKKRGRKKKTVYKNTVNMKNEKDSNKNTKTSHDTEEKLVIATKRGRKVKKPTHYDDITLQKPKRRYNRKPSLTKNQSSTAADSTSVDNVPGIESNNTEVLKKVEHNVISAKKRKRRKKLGWVKRNKISKLNNLNETLESNSEISTFDNNMNNNLQTSSVSTSRKGTKRCKKNNQEEEIALIIDRASNNIEIAGNDDFDDIISLSQLKKVPDQSINIALADQSHVTDDKNVIDDNINKCHNENINITPKKLPGKKGRPRKSQVEATSLKPNDIVNTHNIKQEDDETDDLCLSKLKKSLESDIPAKDTNEETDLPAVQAGSSDKTVDLNEDLISVKRNTKMPLMSDFEYNIDSIVSNDIQINENYADINDNSSTRRRKAKQMPHNYHEESDEDPFANMELSVDEPPKRRKGTKYYSDDEYIPEHNTTGKRRKVSTDSSDCDILDTELDELSSSRKKKNKVSVKSNSPICKTKTEPAEIDDIEEVLQSSVITASTSVGWGASSEFENFLAKKIQGTDLKIKKVSETTKFKAPLEIPVLLPDEKKMIEMCSQTDKINSVSTGVQTSSCYDIPMKENIALTKEQSEKACQFLNDIVKTTAELGQLMTEKSEDFIKKKINTKHVSDTFKMDYCVQKSFLLFKLAKHNLMQMEEDLGKQYEEFLKCNNLSSCRQEIKEIIATPDENGNSDCEIVEEPVTKKSQKTKFYPKTVFLNKELSIKIAKKSSSQSQQPAQTPQKKINIKGRHSVWINDTVMVKKVKPTQSFLAQDSRNKKPPDTFVTEKMVSDFFMEYNRQQALAVCAPFLSRDWIHKNTECSCYYYITQSTELNSGAHFSTDESIEINDHSSNIIPETSIESVKSLAIVNTPPETLFTLCFRIIDKIFNTTKQIKKIDTNNKFNKKNLQPVSLSQLCLDTLFCKDLITTREMNTDSLGSGCSGENTIEKVYTLEADHEKLFDKEKSFEDENTVQIVDKDFINENTLDYDFNDSISNNVKVSFQIKYVKPNADANSKEIMSLFSLCVKLIQSRHQCDEEYLEDLTVLPLKTICYKKCNKILQSNFDSVSIYDQSKTKEEICLEQDYTLEDSFENECILEMIDKDFKIKENNLVFDFNHKSSNNVNKVSLQMKYVKANPVANKKEIMPLFSMCVKLIQSRQQHDEEYVENRSTSDIIKKQSIAAKFRDTSSLFIATQNKIMSLFSLCVKLIQSKQQNICNRSIQSSTPRALKHITFEKVKFILYQPSNGNLQFQTETASACHINQMGDDVLIEGLTINSVNTVSEEAFLNLECAPTGVLNESDYEDNFDNDDSNLYDEGNFESGFNATQDETDDTEPNWVSRVQMKELKSCLIKVNSNQDVEQINEPVIANIKMEPIEDPFNNLIETTAVSIPAVENATVVKTEPGPGLDEMTMIPDINQIKPEIDVTHQAHIQRQNSNSYDCETFENFVRSNKMINAQTDYSNEDIFSQSALRVRRQHEPDLDDENDMGMSLLIPHTYETMNVDTAKGSLMESSSDENNKNKKNPGKKKTDKKSRGRPKKSEQKTVLNKEASSINKEKISTNEVAVLTRRMREKIRQEDGKGDSSDSDNEPLNLKSSTDNSKSRHTSKATDTEIQCNSVDSTANVIDNQDMNSKKFTGFTAIDLNETSSYQKFMKYVYDKIIPDKELAEDKSKPSKSSENVSANKNVGGTDSPIFETNEAVELLECEPTLPIFDEDTNRLTQSRIFKPKTIDKTKETVKYLSQEPTLPEGDPSTPAKSSKEHEKSNIVKVSSNDKDTQFVERNGWQCYPVNKKDKKLYQSPCLLLEKLPETFVETYFQYQNISTNKNRDDTEVDRLTNLSTLNRNTQLKEPKVRSRKLKRGGEHASVQDEESGLRSTSPAYSDHYDELTPSEDEEVNTNEELPPLAPKQTENILAKDSLMNDNDSDSDGGNKVHLKQEPPEDTAPVKASKPGPKSKTKVGSDKGETPDPGSLMLTADKMMNKELTLLHAPIVLNDGDPKSTSIKKQIPRACKQKTSPRNLSDKSNINDEDSSSEEEKQWVTTKEKLLKRVGKKGDAIVDDAKRTKLVSDFIERRGDHPDSHKRPRGRPARSRKKFLERQKQLKILSRELFGEPSTDGTYKRHAQANFKGRRNIRKVIDKKSLARSTVIANMEEFERKKRLNIRQAQLREVLGCEDGVNVLVINDEVCLEYDFEENRPVVTIHPFFTKVMKAHQYEGVKFMWDACFESLSVMESGHAGGGCILAHCMGLGKTLQVLALLHTVLTHPGVGMRRVLVCCPLSTVLNWVDEIHKWIGPVTNEIKVFELSKLKKTYERAYQLEDWYNGGGIFIIGYELFRSLTTLDPFIDNIRPTIVNKIRTALLDPGPDIIVCDEGHLLKNDCSVLAVAMSRVVTKRRIVLTGTPMQNNLREYYCMVNFVKPNLLGTYSEYSNRFENPIMNGQHRDSSAEDIKLMKARTHILHKVLEGCLQRQEAAVLYPYLPKKHEYTVFIPLTDCQWDMYKHYLSNYAKQSKQSILKDFHILHKIWSHPQVMHNFQTKARDERAKIKAEKLEDDLANEDQEEIKPNETDIWWLEHLDGGKMLDSLESSNKFVVVFRILDECVALGDKMLIFSTSLFCLDALEYFLKKIKNWSLGQEYFRLDGSVPAEVRQKWCREFNADNNVKTKLFLVSTRAGCLGLNMTAANRVIIMDTSWNPAHDIQSIFRVYRFGQKKDCYIYRLVAMGTMEQKIYERSVTKQAVACRVVDEQQIDRHYNSADLTELYLYDESGSSVAGGVAVGVHDVVLLRVARVAALHAVHEHDSLLRGSEPALPEDERVAAWQQFQQEQEDKQIQSRLGVYPPNIKIPLKRIHGSEYAKVNPAIKPEDDKQQDSQTPPAALPAEPKSKRKRKQLIVNCRIPVQDEAVPSVVPTKSIRPATPIILRSSRSNPQGPLVEPMFNDWSFTRKSKPRKRRASKAGPSTSVPNETPAPTNNIDNEEALVQKITDVLLQHNFQDRKMEIGKLIANVKNLVARGEYNDKEEKDELARSIAAVLLKDGSAQLQPRVVTDIVCESICNTTGIDDEPEEITGDLPSTPIKVQPVKERVKSKKTKDKNNDINALSLLSASGVRGISEAVRVTSEPESRTKRKAAIAAGKNIDNLVNDVVINLDDDDDEDWDGGDADFEPDEPDETAPESAVVKPKKNIKLKNPQALNDSEDLTLNENNTSDTRDKPKVKVENLEEKGSIKRIVQKTHTKNKETDRETTSIILTSDEDESPSSQTKLSPETTDVTTKDEVPLPLSLLTNQNFIKIVAHTYLAGNPMLDEDAATLAAQYSTYRALKESELNGKAITSGPIYDIAFKILGKPVLKKLLLVNDKKSTEGNTTEQQMQDNIQFIEKNLKSEPSTSKVKKAKPIKVLNAAVAASQTVTTPIASPQSVTTPVARLQSVNTPVARPQPVATSVARLQPVATPAAKPEPVSAPVASPQQVSAPSNVVPVGLITRGSSANSASFAPQATPSSFECILPDDDECIVSDSQFGPPALTPAPPPAAPSAPVNARPRGPVPRLFYAAPVASPAAAAAATAVQPRKQPKNVIKISQGRVIMPHHVRPPAPAPAPVPTPAPAPIPARPADDTICLDSDDEEAPPVPVALHAGGQLRHVVPVSLTAAHSGANLLLPAGRGPGTVVPRNEMPVYMVPASRLQHVPPTKETPARLPVPPLAATEAPRRPVTKTLCKPGDMFIISETGQIEILTPDRLPPSAPAASPAPANVPIAPKPAPSKSASAPEVRPAPAPPVESRVWKSSESPTKPTTSRRLRDSRSSVDSQESRVRQISSSSSDSSRSSSPDNPLSILKDVVHIQAVEEPSRRARKSIQATKNKTAQSNIKVQHVVSVETNSNSKARSLSAAPTKSNRAVMDISHPSTTVSRNKAQEVKTKSALGLATSSAASTSKYRPPKEPEKAKPKKGPTKVVGTMNNIILDSGKGLMVKTKNQTPPNIKMIVTQQKDPTDNKKRPSTAAETTSSKKPRKEPLSLKDFDIDDIDDIIELE